MKKSFTILFLSIYIHSFSQTSIPAGNVSGTWNLSGSPYQIQGTIQIPNGQTLSIDPGVTVEFEGIYKLNVQGRLLAIGTITDTIIFKVANTTNGWLGIRFDNTPAANDTSKIEYCKLQYGKASGSSPNDNGGAFYLNNFSKIIISNSNISNCSANNSGGGIYCYNSSPIIIHNTISNNTATSSPITSRAGGIYCEGTSNPIISYNIISNNTGSVCGGILCMSSSIPIISYNTISNNSSPHGSGGGIYCTTSTSPTITYNTITNNTGGEGGGIKCFGNSTISNNIISNNTASSGGGGISCSGNATISNNSISNNTAGAGGSGGGGIYCTSGSNLVISNNTITNNKSNNGGGICLMNSSSMITNCSIENNNADNGGAMYCDQASILTLRNCILWGNTANLSGGQVFLNDEASDPNFYYCDVQDSSMDFGLNGNSYSGVYSNNIKTDPKFVSPSGGSGTGFDGTTADWSLQLSSPCIDKGDLNGTYPATDKAGNPRVTICRIDMGAYEYQTGTPLSSTISQTQQILCHGDASAALSANPLGGASSDTYAYYWDNGSTLQSVSGLTAGVHSVTVSTTISQCQIAETYTVTEPAQIILSPTHKDDNGCNTINDGTITENVSGGTQPYIYQWSTTETTQIISGLAPGNFSVTIVDNNGCSAVDFITVGTFSSTITVSFTSINATCHTADGSLIANPSGGTNPYNYVWSNGSSAQTANNLLAGNYTVNVTDNNGCTATNSSSVGISAIIATPNICMVTVDSLSHNNVIVWDKTSYSHIDSFIVYRETSANIYSPIGAVVYNTLSLFVDTVRAKYFPNTGNPNAGTYRYKLKMRDSCGNYSQLSPYHNTVYLINNGGTFSWPQLYTIEGSSNPVSNYVLLRDNNSNGNWAIVNSVTGSQQTVTDPQYSTYQNTASWRVETQWSIACNPTRINPEAFSFNSSRSNIFSFVTAVNEYYNNSSVSIYPNPFSETTTLRITNGNRIANYSLAVTDIYGKMVYADAISNKNEFEIHRNNLPVGMYFYKVTSGEIIIATGKLVIE